jgi:hypothetical protein
MGTRSLIALALVALAGLYFIVLGGLMMWRPDRATGFLQGFAATAARHAAELGLRLVLGVAFVQASAHLPWPAPFVLFGWLLIVTTAALALVPWRRHQAFTRVSVARVSHRMPLIGVCAIALGLGISASAVVALFGAGR